MGRLSALFGSRLSSVSLLIVSRLQLSIVPTYDMATTMLDHENARLKDVSRNRSLLDGVLGAF